ncbi:MAG: NAD(P)(+) transhydrogenase (Re/Si-specific) subunit alpha [Alphaproteobacteria bacterium CG_4_10_14_0_8_um_filter_53_9]|nr:MAG: NAD(P)(+) transhydrogenase (Re/Si-specific) subunit alpha [Alphaproteobacteria bacterium CG_4_10_14_0_8_um_filter_53_9]
MLITIASEITAEESRVALTPDVTAKLLKKYQGLSISIEAGAGLKSGFPDTQYEAAGAKVLKSKDWAAQKANVYLRLTPPAAKAPLPLAKDGVLVGLNAPAGLASTTLTLEKLPRTSRAQSMDVLSSQANLAGYAAVLLAAGHLPKLMPMLMTAAGSAKPAQVLILGVGVAGLQAIATAKRLGAQVTAFDVRPEVAEQITSLGAKPLQLDMSAAGEGGYAKKLNAEETKALQAALTPAIQSADIVITTAQIPGAPAPVLVTAAAANGMKPASVLVDMAAAGYNRANKIAGGNCPLTKVEEVVHSTSGAILLAPANLASHLSATASQFWATNMQNLLALLLKQEEDKSLTPTLEDELLQAMKVA